MSTGKRPRELSQDAVVVIPGLMGSTLVETATGAPLWGLDPSAYAEAWTRGRRLETLRLSDDERSGRYGRITATGLLRAPAWAPVLAGVEPYTRLVDAVRTVVGDPAAVLEFAYDWRLPVEHNARLLADRAHRHLSAWQRHPRHDEVRALRPDGRPAQLVLVAHSMGGLVARAMALIPGAMEQVRAAVTLGTPFGGAAKAAVILNSGRRSPVPLPRRRLRRLAATMPGLHDLLPTYRCIDDGQDVRRLSPDDVVGLGGDHDLALAAAGMHQRTDAVALPGHTAVVGDAQPTLQTLRLQDGVATASCETFVVNMDGQLVRDRGQLVRHDAVGDGTVPIVAAHPANPADMAPQTLPQQHSPLAKTDEALAAVRAAVLGRHLGGRLGEGDVGIELPDLVAPGQAWTLQVHGAEPHAATCTVHDAGTDQPIGPPYPVHVRDGQVLAEITLPAPGLYRVNIAAGGTSPISQLVLAAEPAGDDTGSDGD